MKRVQKQLTIKMRAYSHSYMGKLIEFLQEHPQGTSAVAMEVLNARFLPFLLDKSDSRSRDIALQCAAQLDGYARAIRLSWELPLPLDAERVISFNSQSDCATSGSTNGSEDSSEKSSPEISEEDRQFNAREQRRKRMFG
jgi:hypothetical protein